MGESAMVGESYGRPPEAADDIKVGSLGCEGKRQRGEGRLAIESGTPHTRAGQEVGNGFQSVICILFHDAECEGVSNVKASGTIVISAGKLPISSPSAST